MNLVSLFLSVPEWDWVVSYYLLRSICTVKKFRTTLHTPFYRRPDGDSQPRSISYLPSKTPFKVRVVKNLWFGFISKLNETRMSLAGSLIFRTPKIGNIAAVMAMTGIRKASSVQNDLSASKAAMPDSDPAVENLRLRRQVKIMEGQK